MFDRQKPKKGDAIITLGDSGSLFALVPAPSEFEPPGGWDWKFEWRGRNKTFEKRSFIFSKGLGMKRCTENRLQNTRPCLRRGYDC